MKRVALILLFAVAGCSGREVAPSGADAVANETPASGPASGTAAPGETRVVGGDEASLREFVGRALTYHYPGAEGGTTVLIGALPEDLSFELPVPESARVIGSILRGPLSGGAEVILDVDLTAEEALAFYQERMLDAGWEEPPQQAYSGGFVSGSWPGTTFCLGTDEALITLSTYEASGQPTEIRLSIQQPAQYSACLPESTGMDAASRLIPVLESPPGSLIQSGGGSSGEGMADTSAVLSTELSPGELALRFAGQLEEAGWKQQAQDEAQEVAWSAWTKHDSEGQEWSGLLLIYESPIVPDKIFAWFRVDRGT